jgi:hypothetical protein
MVSNVAQISLKDVGLEPVWGMTITVRYLHTDMVMTFDSHGRQIADLQGPYNKVKDRARHYCDYFYHLENRDAKPQEMKAGDW